jgi:AcrR family transcriptional regulator
MDLVEPARSRREEYAEATYQALLDSAAACFAQNGFAATSLDEVAQHARLTKGAIYHHFASKRDLFRAVLERQSMMAADQIAQAGAEAPDTWTGIVQALDVFLGTVSEPVYQRLCWIEGPSALGFEEWWACGEKYEIEVIRTLMARAAEVGDLAFTDLGMLAHVIFGAVVAGVLAMARSEAPDVERERFRGTMLTLFAGLFQTAPTLA